jgi:hypothetical protein
MAGSEHESARGQESLGRVSIIIGVLILSRLFLVALYAASMSPGTAPSDFATMIVFP